MITCPNCLKKHENGAKVCDECGYDLLMPADRANKISAVRIEESDALDKENISEESESAADGSDPETVVSPKDFEDYLDINDEEDDMPYDAYRYQKKKNPRKLRRFNKTAFLRVSCICLAAIFVVTSVILILNYFFGEKKYPKYVLYVQDGALMYYGIDNEKTLDLSVDLDAVVDLDGYLKLCRLSDDGDILFFPSEYEYGESSVALSFIDFSSKKPQVTAIGYDVAAYSINKKANKVIYLKEGEDGGKLFSYATGTMRRVLLADGVNRFVTSDDGAKIVYYETNEALMKVKGSKKTKIADEGYIAWAADDNLYYYVFEETDDGYYQRLYYHDGKNNTRVLADWAEVVTYVDGFKGAIVAAYTDDGTVLYYVAGGKATQLKIQDPDFFMANNWVSEDGKTLYYLDEPDESYYSDYYDPGAVFEGLLFEMKLKKDGCKAAEEIAEDVNGGEFVDGEVFVYRKNTSEEDGSYALYRDGELVDKAVVGIVGVNGKDLIYYKNNEDYNGYSLFKNGSMIADEVLSAVMIDGEAVYLKSSEDDNYLINVYCDKKLIAKNVYDVSFYKDKKIAFCTDFNDEKGNGRVNLYENGKLTVISGDVYEYKFTLSGDIAYIADVDESTGFGDIYCYYDKKTKRIAKGVDSYYMDIVDAIGVVSEGKYVDVVNDVYE